MGRRLYGRYRKGNSGDWTNLPNSVSLQDSVNFTLTNLDGGSAYQTQFALVSTFASALAVNFTTMAAPSNLVTSISGFPWASDGTRAGLNINYNGSGPVFIRYRTLPLQGLAGALCPLPARKRRRTTVPWASFLPAWPRSTPLPGVCEFQPQL